MKHPHLLAFLIANVLSLVFAWWVSSESPHASSDEKVGGAIVAVIVITVLAVVDFIIGGAMLIHWMVKG